MSEGSKVEIQILYSTQTGHSKACARRCARILKQSVPNNKSNVNNDIKINEKIKSFDDYDFINHARSPLCSDLEAKRIFICFISTTGEGNQTCSIEKTWKYMLSKNLSSSTFDEVRFACFGLGDSDYGPELYCAASRKFCVRLQQLGGELVIEQGFGNDNDDEGGYLHDLDVWLDDKVLPFVGRVRCDESRVRDVSIPFQVEFDDMEEKKDDDEWYRHYLSSIAPLSVYEKEPYEGITLDNNRLTSPSWHQTVHHVTIGRSNKEFDYKAGDVAVVYPHNSKTNLSKFISTLSPTLQSQLYVPFRLSQGNCDDSLESGSYLPTKSLNFYGYLKYCANLTAAPEREELRLLSYYCNTSKPEGKAQSEKLLQLSSTEGNALYIDYIIRQRRNFIDVVQDFDTIEFKLVKEVIHLLPTIEPRYFSIASEPSSGQSSDKIELCVAQLSKVTTLKRQFIGFCSTFLISLQSLDKIYFWIQPGSFHQIPIEISSDGRRFQKPLLCICAGTGIAPCRALIRYRESIRHKSSSTLDQQFKQNNVSNTIDTMLLFGCRKEHHDFLYKHEWDLLSREEDHFQLYTAFSQENSTLKQKVYVQYLLEHQMKQQLQNILEGQGAIYIAGNVKMCTSVKEVITDFVSRQFFHCNIRKAKVYLNKLNRLGLFCVEAW